MENTRREIRTFLVGNFFLAAEGRDLGDGDSFIEKGVLDSTGVLELVAFVEGRFGIKVTDEDLVPENLDSIERLAAFVDRKR